MIKNHPTVLSFWFFHFCPLKLPPNRALCVWESVGGRFDPPTARRVARSSFMGTRDSDACCYNQVKPGIFAGITRDMQVVRKFSLPVCWPCAPSQCVLGCGQGTCWGGQNTPRIPIKVSPHRKYTRHPPSTISLSSFSSMEVPIPPKSASMDLQPRV